MNVLFLSLIASYTKVFTISIWVCNSLFTYSTLVNVQIIINIFKG